MNQKKWHTPCFLGRQPFLYLVVLTISYFSGWNSSAVDLYRKTVEVYNTGGVGLKAWTSTCTGTSVIKADGTRGIVNSTTSQLCSGFNRWQIRWSGDVSDRWSAEDWLRVIPPNLTINGSVSRSPSPIVAGNSLHVTCDIANVGEGNARTSSTKVLILRAVTFEVIATDDFIETVEIPSGYYTSFSYDIALPTNMPPGNYLARIEVDSQGDIGQTAYGDDLKDSSIFAVVPVYTVTANAGTGGSISPNGAQTVPSGSSIIFTATPNVNYGENEWAVNGSVVQTGGATYELSNITSDKTVRVSFVRLYNLTLAADGQGTCSSSPPGGKYAAGTRVTVTASPASGNQFSDWHGAHSCRTASFSFDKGGSDEVITARFVQNISPPNITLVTAGSTPATIGLAVPTTPSWFTFIESCSNFQQPEWSILDVIQGNGTVVNYPIPVGSTNGYVRIGYFPKVTTAPFLEFPLKGASDGPSTWPVTAVFDHSLDLADVVDANPVIGPYIHDNTIRNALGVTFTVPQDRRNQTIAPAPITAGDLTSLFNYQDSEWLYYDGHVGYDFRADETTGVYAAEGGQVVTGGGADNCGAAGLEIADLYMKYRHALIIKHDNDYCTVYMHLSAINSDLADTNNWDFWKPKVATVIRGQQIGKAGNYLRNCTDGKTVPLGTHFHFEVWRKEGGKWYFADPYGFQYKGNIVTSYLWVQP